MSELLRCHRSAAQTTVVLVNQAVADDLERPTPCADWTLQQLLAHMVGQNYGFAAAADGDGAELADFAQRPVGEQAAAEHAASVNRVVEAFATLSVVDGEMFLPEVRGGMTLPASIAVGFHLVDCVAHGWDVAKCLGLTPDFDADVLAVGLEIAQSVPEEARSPDPRAPFRPSVSTTSNSVLDQIVATLGRLPGWAPPA